ncbi:unnamed protein product, partial [Prorocentrum cordatum]
VRFALRLAARARLAGHHGDRGRGPGMAQQQPRQSAASAQQPNWACAASRLCGFRTNFASRETCWKCGRDRLGRMVRESPASSEQGARQGLAALQKLGYADEHPLILAARQELASLEAEERRAQPPEQLLVSLQKRMEEALARASQVADNLVEALAKVDDLRRQQVVADAEVKNLETEVQAAQRAVAASAASSSGVDLAALASTLVGLQAALASAPARVASGQGINVLEAIGQQ